VWEGVGRWLRIMVGCDENTFEREEGNVHSPPDIHYSKKPNKGKRVRVIILGPVQGHSEKRSGA